MRLFPRLERFRSIILCGSHEHGAGGHNNAPRGNTLRNYQLSPKKNKFPIVAELELLYAYSARKSIGEKWLELLRKIELLNVNYHLKF